MWQCFWQCFVLSSVFNLQGGSGCEGTAEQTWAHPGHSSLTAAVPSALLSHGGAGLSHSSAFVLGENMAERCTSVSGGQEKTEKGSFIICSKNTGRAQMKSEFRRGERPFPAQTQKCPCPWRGQVLRLGQSCALQMIFFLSNLNLTSDCLFKAVQYYSTD